MGDASGAVLVPDSGLLFNGDFFRLGPDLYIVNDGAANFRVPDYFARPQPADLTDPNGAILRGDLVERLAGPVAPGQYAQAGTGDFPSPIGQVEAAEGSASVQRSDGTVEPLEVGSVIYQNDVVATGQDGAVSLTFVDGTIFTLSAASRMVIDELIYDPQSEENSGTFSLIQGGFVFIAGQVAKTGGMEVSTPSSTMGIRGTTVVVQVATVDGVDTTEVSLTNDPDGARGRVELRDVDGNLVATITQTDTKWVVSAATGEVREVARSPLDAAEDNLLIAEAFAAYRSAVARVEAGDAFVSVPTSRTGTAGRGTAGELETDQNLDGLDEPAAIPPVPPPVETDEGTEPPEPFDEGLNAIQDEGPVIVVTGLEDAGEADAIMGDVSVISGVVGTVFALASSPSNGTVTLTADGQFDYVPDPDFNGTDSFTFSASEPGGAVVEGTVLVQVAAVNDAPVADDTAVTGPEDTAVTGVIAARDVDGDPLSYTITDLPQNGEVTLFPDGTFSYRPDADFTGTDSFGVLVMDPDGETAQASVTLTISPVNDAPVITTVTGANLGSVVESDGPADARGQLTAEDPDRAGPINWSGASSAALFGTFSITAAGAWTYLLDSDRADRLAEGETVIETFTAVATDIEGATVAQQVEVTLTGTNDAPMVAQNTVFETMPEGSITGQLAASDVDSAAFVFALGSDGPSHGVLALGTDGSFEYTPTDGFVGLDRFSYTVTDAQGGVSAGQVTIAVESASGGTGSQAVSLSFQTEPDEGTAAGALTIDSTAVEPPGINLVIAMDSSGSIGEVDWAVQREAVKDAILLLADRFEGSATSVDVQIISYSNAASSIGPFDLQDPDLPDAILALPFLRGATRWDLALDEANSLLAAQPADETNLLLFITDGVPDSDRWRDSLEALTNPPGNAFDIDIQAFGIGDRYDPTLLQEIDPEPTILQSAEDLANALTEVPVFVPRLISLDLSLTADDTDHGTIATEQSAGLIVDGTDYALPLASIENIEALLGVSNRISAQAQFDLDGDLSTAEIELFSSEVLGKAETPQNTDGQNGADLLFGSDFAEEIGGGAGDDVIFGFDGADTLDGGSGADVILAGAGDDVLRVTEAPEAGVDVLDGGSGRDVLQIDVAGDLSEELLPTLDLRDIEAIDMDNGQANVLEISLEDVIDLSSTGDGELETLLDRALPESAIIYGDSSDSLLLVSSGTGGFQKVSDTPIDDGKGNTLDVYSYVDGGNVLATLGVDTDIDVTGAIVTS
ncbi:Ig-like domain-containing protein [Roseobacter sinensis]|uniref:Ig-like domain-containing protein n=1 Tax=Roseobacter sinensis TaxID=2931391 RepID=A0ABT3BK75_9RHOB|nr:Ig-like domain-containing protein [Roseobacter sp. WL0113]MCV3273978.1 Ig-like domain-containing protein [Roseobacter sp. WL0113]